MPAVAVAESSATAKASPAAPWARTSFRLWTRFIYIQRSPAHVRAVQCRNGPLRFSFICHLHKRKAPRPPGLPVSHDAHALNCSIRFKEGPYRLFTNTEV